MTNTKVIVITGFATGLGRSTAIKLAKDSLCQKVLKMKFTKYLICYTAPARLENAIAACFPNIFVPLFNVK